MIFADTHTHLYLKEFDEDRESVWQQCLEAGMRYLFLPNIDLSSIRPMLDFCAAHPGCHPMMGLHPSEVDDNYKATIATMQEQMEGAPIAGIGEIGMDLYWDKSYASEQQQAFHAQLAMAAARQLPAIIHCRKAFAETWEVIKTFREPLKGIFHCFAGDTAQARKVIEKGFLIGVGGTVTYKNSGIQEVVRETELAHIVLETDSPFLPPVPFRGQRNASHHIPVIAQKVAELKNIPLETVAEVTTANAKRLFGLDD